MSLLILITTLVIVFGWMLAIACIINTNIATKTREYAGAFFSGVAIAFSPLLWTLDKLVDLIDPLIDRRLERRLIKKAKLVWHNNNELRLVGSVRRVVQKREKTLGSAMLVQIPHTDTWYVLNGNREVVRERDKQLENVYHLFMDRVGAEQLAADYLYKLAAPAIEGNGSTALYGSCWRAQRWQATDCKWYPEFMLVWPGTNEVIGTIHYWVALSGCMVEYQDSNSKFETSPQCTTTIDELPLTLNDAVHEIERKLTSFDTRVPFGTSLPNTL